MIFWVGLYSHSARGGVNPLQMVKFGGFCGMKKLPGISGILHLMVPTAGMM